MRPTLALAAGLLLAAAAPPPSPPSPPSPDLAQLVAAQARPFEYRDGKLSGPGAAFLDTAMAARQFLLFGEDHYFRETPLFAAALYRRLNNAHGFDMLVVEQDELAVADVLAPGVRGDATAIGRLVARYPQSFEFGSDQDIALLALAGRLVPGPTAICSAEQALGAVRYFDELLPLAPDAPTRGQLLALKAAATAADPEARYSVNWLAAADTAARLAALRDQWRPVAGSRADALLTALERSVEIFGYYRRAAAGEPVGLFNNTVREAWMKQRFLACYKAAGGGAQKAMFKFGANHMGHGRNPTNAFPIGNFVHELSIANGAQAYGIFVVPLVDGYKDLPESLRILLPATPPTAPTIIDLEPLRPQQRAFRRQLPETEVAALAYLINGFEAIVLLPGEAPATMRLSGLASPGE
jgi:hypothetical protein